jgi:phage portal protein BeeE
MEAKHGAAREIALALGVPPMLLGIPGDNTFSNYQEANRTFWRQTVLPLVQRTTDALSEWLTAGYGPAFSLKADIDDIPALASERDVLWTRIDKATTTSSSLPAGSRLRESEATTKERPPR